MTILYLFILKVILIFLYCLMYLSAYHLSSNQQAAILIQQYSYQYSLPRFWYQRHFGFFQKSRKPSKASIIPSCCKRNRDLSWYVITGCVWGGVDERLKNISCLFNSKLHPQIFLVNVLEDATVEVVNAVMNNMENYLPGDVIQQDKNMCLKNTELGDVSLRKYIYS